MPDSPRTFREKMLWHLKEAETFHQAVLDIEEATDKEVTRRYGHRIGNLNSHQERASQRQLYMKKVLVGNVWYERAVGNRNYHVEMARTYGIAALADPYSGATFGPPPHAKVT